ncbi:unnamed protein product [Periconia digitata]|uniref:Uncharacterized protein n=1 Tax=Periconia digitata TaxID=1303443 RepID=A0A9W4UMD0_9PLEO|nr:unnamed protein product [Periconia digitata]
MMSTRSSPKAALLRRWIQCQFGQAVPCMKMHDPVHEPDIVSSLLPRPDFFRRAI